MAANWGKIAGDAGVGLIAGGVDSFIQDKTDAQVKKFNELPANIAAKKKLSVLSQYSTYYNYGLPIIAVIAAAMGYPRGDDWQTRMIVAAGGIAGRKAGADLISYSKETATEPAPWHEYSGHAAAAQAARAAQAAAMAAAREANYNNITPADQLLV